MDIIRAKEIVTALAEGIDPTTGEMLPDDSVCNKAEIVRALYAVLGGCGSTEQVKKTIPKTKEEPTDYDEVLFKLLKELRTRIAKERNLPPYMVFQDLTLKYFALIKPTTDEEFLMIYGVGKSKAEQYGDAFLNEINDYISKQV